MNEIIRKINKLELSFTTSFKHTSRIKFNVDFDNSNPNQILKNLEKLKNNIEQNITTGKHVGCRIYIEDVQMVSELILALITHYYKINSIFAISNNLKLYTLINEIRQNEVLEIEDIVKKVITHIKEPKMEITVDINPLDIGLKYALKRKIKRQNNQ